MLLIELNSISNMGCQKIKVVQSLRYSGYLTNTSCVCQVAKEKVVHFWQDQSRFLEAPFVRMLRMRSASLKIGVLAFETLKKKI